MRNLAALRMLILLWSVSAALASISAGEGPARGLVRIGDAGSLPDPTRFDPRFPEMAEWAKAGVEGGVPHVDRIVGTAKPGDDLQALITGADVAPDRLGVLLLAPGRFVLPDVLSLKPGLVLRGSGATETILVSNLNEARADHGVMERHAIDMKRSSALEDLTVLNGHVEAMDEAVYQGKYENPGAPKSGLVAFRRGSNNGWLQRCRLTHAGSNPLSITDVQHITIRDCVIEKAHNKGGKGHGYLELGKSSHILFYDCDIRDLRHLSIMWASAYVVIIHCRFNIDINYHDGLPTTVLVEQSTIRRRRGHHWSAISFGWPPWQKVGPGPRNFFWNNQFDGEGSGNANVWVLRDTTGGYESLATTKPMVLDFGAPPTGGTLYAVNARHIPVEEVQKDRLAQRLQAAQGAKHWPTILAVAPTVRDRFAAGEPQHELAVTLLAEAEGLASAELERVQRRPTATAYRRFLELWPGTAAATQARADAATAATEAWERLAGSREPSAAQVRSFLTDWAGLGDPPAAQERFAALAATEWERRGARMTPPQLQAFVQQWPGTPAAESANTALTAELRRALEALVARKAQLSQRERQGFAAQFAGTALEQEARAALLD